MRIRVRLMRVTVPTDVDPVNEPNYRGSFTDYFMVENNHDIVGVDWSVNGECTVTLAVSQ